MSGSLPQLTFQFLLGDWFLILWLTSGQAEVCLVITVFSPTLLLSWLRGRESVRKLVDSSILDL